ncbi:MAG: RNA polymerase-binding protein DksA [Desulfobulbaceae bacterium]|jgi:DnaK suppressor protein|nr:RNA polymerase-binding protein DksA [Desulfobulbaceae bacterium]
MDQDKLAYYKDKLEQLSQDILKGADKTLTDMTDNSSNFPDPTDRASAESDRNFELRLRDRERKLLNKIKQASERIEDESFGLCEDCGAEIGEKRLEARPVTSRCIKCKTAQENSEKGQG